MSTHHNQFGDNRLSLQARGPTFRSSKVQSSIKTNKVTDSQHPNSSFTYSESAISTDKGDIYDFSRPSTVPQYNKSTNSLSDDPINFLSNSSRRQDQPLGNLYPIQRSSIPYTQENMSISKHLTDLESFYGRGSSSTASNSLQQHNNDLKSNSGSSSSSSRAYSKRNQLPGPGETDTKHSNLNTYGNSKQKSRSNLYNNDFSSRLDKSKNMSSLNQRNNSSKDKPFTDSNSGRSSKRSTVQFNPDDDDFLAKINNKEKEMKIRMSNDEFAEKLKNSTILGQIDIPEPDIQEPSKIPRYDPAPIMQQESIPRRTTCGSKPSSKKQQSLLSATSLSSKGLDSRKAGLNDSTSNKRSNLFQESKHSKQRKIETSDLSPEEIKLMRIGRKTASKLTKLTNKLNDDDSFLSRLKSSEVWNPESESKSNLEDDLALNLNQDISIGLNNDLEVIDETQNNIKQKRRVEDKYKNKSYNGALSSSELKSKVEAYWDCIPGILKGQIGSHYLDYASSLSRASKTSMMSRGDFLGIPKSRISIGFYGMKRQSFIASLIKKKFSRELNSAALTSKVVQYWTLDSFALYVLTCEIVLRIVKDDLNLSQEKAIECLEDTLDYGKYITDNIPLY